MLFDTNSVCLSFFYVLLDILPYFWEAKHGEREGTPQWSRVLYLPDGTGELCHL